MTQMQQFLDGQPSTQSIQSELGWPAAFMGLLHQEWIDYLN